MSITASTVVSFRSRPRSTAITSRRSSSHTGDDPSHSGVGGPPPVGAMITLPSAVKAIRDPSGEICGPPSSQKAARVRPVVRRTGCPPSTSIAHMSDVSRSRAKATSAPSGDTSRWRGRSVAAIASRRQCGGGSTSGRPGLGIPPTSSTPIHNDAGISATGSLLETHRVPRPPGRRTGRVRTRLLARTPSADPPRRATRRRRGTRRR